MTRRSKPQSKSEATAPQVDDADALVRSFLATMLVSGVPTPIIYAFLKTGRVAAERNWSLLTAEEQEEWNGAVREYEQSRSAHSADGGYCE
jgi:hypothetical protein